MHFSDSSRSSGLAHLWVNSWVIGNNIAVKFTFCGELYSFVITGVSPFIHHQIITIIITSSSHCHHIITIIIKLSPLSSLHHHIVITSSPLSSNYHHLIITLSPPVSKDHISHSISRKRLHQLKRFSNHGEKKEKGNWLWVKVNSAIRSTLT